MKWHKMTVDKFLKMDYYYFNLKISTYYVGCVNYNRKQKIKRYVEKINKNRILNKSIKNMKPSLDKKLFNIHTLSYYIINIS